MDNRITHWTENPKWTNALDVYYAQRDESKSTFELDMKEMEDLLFGENTPAYEFMEAMQSVYELEGYDGHRGAPRLILALLTVLNEACKK